MNFFERQEEARRRTRWLIALFALATLCIATAVSYAVACLVWSFASSPLPFRSGLPPRLWLEGHAVLVGASALAVLTWIAVGSLLEARRLRGGGGVVARRLGGVCVAPGARDPQQIRLRHVVEEMAIASGLPVPEVYLLPGERGINAFAAGLTVADAAIAVTEGCLRRLERRELQGVIAHEFSHIQNGDMRLNTRLLGALQGILSITILGRELRGGAGRSSRAAMRSRLGAPVWLFGLALSGIGRIGVLFARCIQAAVSRQRELLADGSAVQLTRDPEGLAGALAKIARVDRRSWLGSSRSEAVSHMLFAAGRQGRSRWFATHPPLALRIRTLVPSFVMGDLVPRLPGALASGSVDEESSASPLASAGAAASAARVDPDEVVRSVGRPGAEHLEWARSWLEELPKALRDAASSVEAAPSLVCALLLSERERIRAGQLERVARHLGERASSLVQTLALAIAAERPSRRLPLIDLALPAVRAGAPRTRASLQALVRELIDADGEVSLFEFALGHRLQGALEEIGSASGAPARPRRRVTLSRRRPEVERLVARLAHLGSAHPAAAAAAYAAGVARLPRAEWSGYRTPDESLASLEGDLRRLDDLVGVHKQRVIGAVAAAIVHDGRITLPEAELLAALCAALHSPLPALVTQR
ncbi:MAG: M48 family metalloprotease [Myxococcota bacterium]